ncbi:MAG: hypothetical protein V4609_16965 [Pseudomonadota bacterium]
MTANEISQNGNAFHRMGKYRLEHMHVNRASTGSRSASTAADFRSIFFAGLV